MKTEILHSIRELSPTEFNRIADPRNPFLEYEFLDALETSGCVGESTTWKPRYIRLTEKGQTIAILTFYIKYDSYGEYIFDWEWIRLYHEARLPYFPKIVVAIPFTPATGSRILYDAEFEFNSCAGELIQALLEYASSLNASSIHFLCLTQKEQNFLEESGFLSRITHQYHWKNQNYKIFDDFLSDIRSKRKKQIRRERNSIHDHQIKTYIVKGEDAQEKHIQAIWSFYQDTHSKKWGAPYLNRAFFDSVFENHPHRVLLVMAEKEGRIIAGTFNYYKTDRLFGRYWGAIENYPNLHFECCFYKLIEFSIENNIHVFEAGAQGEHKFLRGFAAAPIYSSHYIFHEQAKELIRFYLERERSLEMKVIEDYNLRSPLKYLNS